MPRYAPDQRAAAVARAIEVGPYAAATDLGVSPRTVIGWVNAAVPERCEAQVFDGYSTHPCRFAGVRRRDGHRVCLQHDRSTYLEWQPFDVADGPVVIVERRWWEDSDSAA